MGPDPLTGPLRAPWGGTWRVQRGFSRYVAGGLLRGRELASNAEIAQLLSLSPKTVANYVSNILHKLQVADREEAAVRAREAGL